jgi:hypothetical protein
VVDAVEELAVQHCISVYVEMGKGKIAINA